MRFFFYYYYYLKLANENHFFTFVLKSYFEDAFLKLVPFQDQLQIIPFRKIKTRGH